MWCANNPLQANLISPAKRLARFQAADANELVPARLRMMLLFAAMFTCRIPLSAAGWVNRLFVPVRVV
ncbi:uncharacterized protein P884DRAFT_304022 [Thermothelomyces heterothallicus CBS 202.75]|uniref:uncharacterized protein n=1 Tax=Thermothelomyces heterothallicus CBS 202.75 TaxID=1149848 RepID=UPI0037443695